MTLRTLNYGNYGIFLIMGNAGFCPSSVSKYPEPQNPLVQTSGHSGFRCAVSALGVWGLRSSGLGV